MDNHSLLTTDTLLQLARMAFYLISIGILCAGAVGVVALWKSGESAIAFNETFSGLQVLRMTTIVIIVMSVFFLTLIGSVKAETSLSVFSGIAGYVLGGMDQRGSGRAAKPNKGAT
jgi:hypothetical protein